MRNINKVTFVVVLCAVLLACVTSAFADSSYTVSASIPMAKTDWTKDIVIPQFDSKLGTLTGIDTSVSATIDTILTVENTGGSGSTGHANTHFVLNLTDGGNNTVATINFLSPDYVFTGLGAGQTITSGTISQTAVVNDSFNDPGALAAFTGTGTLTFTASTFTEAGVFYNGGNASSSQTTDASAIGTVTYHYTPTTVPEPSSFLGLAGMLIPTAFMLKRRKA